MQTAFTFLLPKGLIDDRGVVHREGVMRLATAMDEIAPQSDPRVVANPAYAPLVVLARVINQLGGLSALTPVMLEGLFAADLVYLQDFYLRINSAEPLFLETICPHCQEPLRVQTTPQS